MVRLEIMQYRALQVQKGIIGSEAVCKGCMSRGADETRDLCTGGVDVGKGGREAMLGR